MKNARRMPQWMEDFKSVHGIYPIAGGSGNEPPPAQPAVPEGGGSRQPGTIEVPVEEEPEQKPDGPVTETPAAQQGFQAGAEEGFVSKSEMEQALARARQQEKDKLYGRIEDMDAQLRAMREAEEARQREIEERERREQEEAERKQEEEMELRDLLSKKEQEWQERFQSMEQELQTRDAILERERQFQALEAYKAQALAQHEEEIMPELRDMVQGTTPEEIDASIASMKERTARILGEVQAFQQQQRQQMPGPRVTAPAMGPLEQNETANQTVTATDIANMDMNTYRANRDRLLKATSQKAREGGLYG